MVSTLLEVAGLAAIVAAAFAVEPELGLLAAGVALFVVGLFLESD